MCRAVFDLCNIRVPLDTLMLVLQNDKSIYLTVSKNKYRCYMSTVTKRFTTFEIKFHAANIYRQLASFSIPKVDEKISSPESTNFVSLLRSNENTTVTNSEIQIEINRMGSCPLYFDDNIVPYDVQLYFRAKTRILLRKKFKNSSNDMSENHLLILKLFFSENRKVNNHTQILQFIRMNSITNFAPNIDQLLKLINEIINVFPRLFELKFLHGTYYLKLLKPRKFLFKLITKKSFY